MASYPGHVWSDDCVQDACLPERDALPPAAACCRLLPLLDESTRQGLAIHVATRSPAARVLQRLEGRGAAGCRRVPPGGLAERQRQWAGGHRGGGPHRAGDPADQHPVSIAPGHPWENGIGERFNGPRRDEGLTPSACAALAEARRISARFRLEYNDGRPPRALGYRPPAQCTRAWLEPHATVAPL